MLKKVKDKDSRSNFFLKKSLDSTPIYVDNSGNDLKCRPFLNIFRK